MRRSTDFASTPRDQLPICFSPYAPQSRLLLPEVGYAPFNANLFIAPKSLRVR
jgi:hypothetical protein